MFLGEVIKKYRSKHEMTMENFAEKAGLSKGYISMLEKNKNPRSARNLIPSLDTFRKVAGAMNIDVDELVRLTDGKQLVRIDNEPNLEGVTNIIYPAAYPVPILGEICAGDGILCEENYDGTFYVDKSIKADICLRVKGESMIEAGIDDGDIVFVSQCYEYLNGKIYAVRINDDSEAFIKKVAWQGKQVILNPCNSDPVYQPIIESVDNISIIGECVGVYHTM